MILPPLNKSREVIRERIREIIGEIIKEGSRERPWKYYLLRALALQSSKISINIDKDLILPSKIRNY